MMCRNFNLPTVILLDEIGVALQRYPELDDTFWEGCARWPVARLAATWPSSWRPTSRHRVGARQRAQLTLLQHLRVHDHAGAVEAGSKARNLIRLANPVLS